MPLKSLDHSCNSFRNSATISLSPTMTLQLIKLFSSMMKVLLSSSDTVWRNGLWDLGVRGRMWRVIKRMYEASRSAVLLDGEKSASFSVEQGVAQGCSLSPILFSVFINDLLKEVEKLGYTLGKVGGMLFADDFVGLSDSKEQLQKLIDVVYSYCNK